MGKELPELLDGNPQIPRDLPEMILKGIPRFLESSAKGVSMYYHVGGNRIPCLKIKSDNYRLQFINYHQNQRLLRLYVDTVEIGENEIRARLSHLQKRETSFAPTGPGVAVTGNGQNYELKEVDFNGSSIEVTLLMLKMPELNELSQDFYTHILRYLIPNIKSKIHKKKKEKRPPWQLTHEKPRLPKDED